MKQLAVEWINVLISVIKPQGLSNLKIQKSKKQKRGDSNQYSGIKGKNPKL